MTAAEAVGRRTLALCCRRFSARAAPPPRGGTNGWVTCCGRLACCHYFWCWTPCEGAASTPHFFFCSAHASRAADATCAPWRRAVFPAAATAGAAGGGAGGWLSAAHNGAAVSEWYAAVADMVGWKLADWEIALRRMGRHKVRMQRRCGS